MQFTLRQLMAGVIVSALCAYGTVLKQRSDAFEARAKYHRGEWLRTQQFAHGSFNAERLKRLSEPYHWNLVQKYQNAVKRPWLPVDPDPPAPTFADLNPLSTVRKQSTLTQ
jgi:hypothetical protein